MWICCSQLQNMRNSFAPPARTSAKSYPTFLERARADTLRLGIKGMGVRSSLHFLYLRNNVKQFCRCKDCNGKKTLQKFGSWPDLRDQKLNSIPRLSDRVS